MTTKKQRAQEFLQILMDVCLENGVDCHIWHDVLVCKGLNNGDWMNSCNDHYAYVALDNTVKLWSGRPHGDYRTDEANDVVIFK